MPALASQAAAGVAIPPPVPGPASNRCRDQRHSASDNLWSPPFALTMPGQCPVSVPIAPGRGKAIKLLRTWMSGLVVHQSEILQQELVLRRQVRAVKNAAQPETVIEDFCIPYYAASVDQGSPFHAMQSRFNREGWFDPADISQELEVLISP
jgi:hypothetical protein